MSDTNYDLIVIGAGPGGYVAAIRATQLGFNVALVEKRETLGGVCLNEGCIPSKALLESSEHFARTRHELAEHGVDVGEVKLNLKQMMTRKEEIISKLTGGIAGLMKKNKIKVYQGVAELLPKDGDTCRMIIRADKEQELKAKSILLATGSEAIELKHLPFDGDKIINARDALSLTDVPERLLVVGGGVIGLEMGSVWSRLGAQVTVVEMLPQILPQTDPQVAQTLQRSLKKQGLDIRLKTRLERIEVGDKEITATLNANDKQEEMVCDKILVAAGRRARTDDLNLEAVDLKPNKSGQLDIDENFQTSTKGIYAIGDLVTGPMLAHKASDEGVAFAERLAGQAATINYPGIPAVTYTWPEVASVGHTEEQLKEKGIEFNAGKFFFNANGRALCSGMSDGFIKVLATPDSGRILGVHIVGPHASELIAPAATVYSFAGSIHDLAVTSFAHPTLSETFKEAALAVNKEAIHA
jgi:dihydrolipoamide dehydrogenase